MKGLRKCKPLTDSRNCASAQNEEVSTAVLSTNSKPELELGMMWCPVSGCSNHGRKGFKDLVGHIERKHSDILRGEDGAAKTAIKDIIEGLNRVICWKCCKIRAKSYENGLCSSCWKQSLQGSFPSKTCRDISQNEENQILLNIRGKQNCYGRRQTYS